jgi:hypothetical protein
VIQILSLRSDLKIYIHLKTGMCFNNNCAPACQCPNGYFGAMCQYQVSQPSVTTSTACYTTTTTTSIIFSCNVFSLKFA